MALNFWTDTERMVEAPWLFERLVGADLGVGPGERPGRILDVGSAGAPYLADLAALVEELTLVDLRPLEGPSVPWSWSPATNVAVCTGSAAALPSDWGGRFDVVSCISALDHVGLEAYGNAAEEGALEKAARELHRVLRPGGRLLLTVPFGGDWVGTHGDSGGQRVFSRKALVALFPKKRWEWYAASFWRLERGRYVAAGEDEVEAAGYAGHRAAAVIAVELVRK